MTTVDGIESFAFNASGTHLAMKRYAPERKDAARAARRRRRGPGGATLIVRRAGNGPRHDVRQRDRVRVAGQGRLLALAISADDKTGNGVQLFDPETGSLRVLDSAAAIYTGLTWRKDADDLAVLRERNRRPPRWRRPMRSWRGRKLGPDRRLRSRVNAAGFPAGSRIVSYPAALVVRRWPDGVRGDRRVGRKKESPGDEAEGRREAATKLARSRTTRTRTRGTRRAGGRRGLARARRRRHAAAENQREKRSPAQHAGGVARRLRPLRAAWQRSHRTRDAAPPSAARLRGQLGAVCDGAHDRPPAVGRLLVDIDIGYAHEGQGRHRRPVPAGQPRRPLPALPAGRSVLDDRHGDARHRQHLEGRADLVHQPRVRRDGQAEAGIRGRWLDEKRRGGACSTTSSMSGGRRQRFAARRA